MRARAEQGPTWCDGSAEERQCAVAATAPPTTTGDRKSVVGHLLARRYCPRTRGATTCEKCARLVQSNDHINVAFRFKIFFPTLYFHQLFFIHLSRRTRFPTLATMYFQVLQYIFALSKRTLKKKLSRSFLACSIVI